MKRNLMIVASLLTGFAGLSFAGAPVKADFYYTQLASKAVVKPCAKKTACDYTLTMHNVHPNTLWFQDRPEHQAGHMTTADFVKGWNAKTSSFKKSPPNTSVIYFDSERPTDAAITVYQPQYDAANKTLRYSLKVLKGSTLKPGQYRRPVLFIDSSCTPGPFTIC